METNFNEIKQEILRRAKEARACKHEYGRAYAAENLSELSQVIKDNFDWVCDYGVLTVDLIEQYKEDFSTNDIYANQNVKSGYLLCSNATVEVYGSATIVAHDSANVEAYGNTTVTACDSATIVAHDNAKVRAYDIAMIRAYDNAEVEAFDSTTVGAYDSTIILACNNTTVKAYDNATIKASDNTMVLACDRATVEASDNAYCTSLYTIDCKLSDNAIYRVQSTNTVYYANSDIKFVKQ